MMFRDEITQLDIFRAGSKDGPMVCVFLRAIKGGWLSLPKSNALDFLKPFQCGLSCCDGVGVLGKMRGDCQVLSRYKTEESTLLIFWKDNLDTYSFTGVFFG